jgi:transcriptional regulator with XRE-family HTH domain
MQVRLMRLLREKHRITSCQLALASSVSRQRLMQIENEDNRPTEHMEKLVQALFENVIEHRRLELGALEADYIRYRGSLFEYIREEDFL